jgi:hypothetical protein
MQVARFLHPAFLRFIVRHLLLFAVVLLGTLLALAQDSSEKLLDGPLIVDGNSHLVVMEYQNWFGPNAVTFQGTAAMPFLQSPDMQAVSGGYDSADPSVIQTHLQWFEYLGIDAAPIEVTNNVSCIFNSEWFIRKYLAYCTPTFRLRSDSRYAALVRKIGFPQ